VIAITINDGGTENSSITRSFTVTVEADNQAPTISPISNQFTTEDTPAGPISFTVADAETPSDNLIVTAISSNQAFVPDSNLVLAGSGSLRNLTITPASRQTGDANITITVEDSNGRSAGQTFLFRIGAGNHAPIASPQSISMLKNRSRSITLAASDSDGNPLTYLIVAMPANGSLSGAPPNLTYTPNPEITGSDSFQFKASDGSLDSTPAIVSITIGEPPVIRFTSCSTSGGQFFVTLSAAPEFLYVIESSLDLVTWSPAITVANSSGMVNYFDAVAGSARFFRAKQVP
jgi:hypothetical protein